MVKNCWYKMCVRKHIAVTHVHICVHQEKYQVRIFMKLPINANKNSKFKALLVIVWTTNIFIIYVVTFEQKSYYAQFIGLINYNKTTHINNDINDDSASSKSACALYISR